MRERRCLPTHRFYCLQGRMVGIVPHGFLSQRNPVCASPRWARFVLVPSALRLLLVGNFVAGRPPALDSFATSQRLSEPAVVGYQTGSRENGSGGKQRRIKMREIGHFIGGKAVKGTSGRFGDVFDPNTGE